jgi:phosphotransferase system enzyme I (PtsI)
MAGDIVLTPLLIGLGVDELSAGAGSVPRVKRAVQSLDASACRQLVEEIQRLDSAAAILAKCSAAARAHYPELL